MSELNLKNRIIETGMKPADQFQVNPLNHRKHPMKQRKAVEASLREIGWIQGVIENKRTGHLIDGHERVWQALQKDEQTPVPYVLVDLSEEEEKLALAIFDKITSMAEVDADILEQLLQDVQTDEAELMNVIEEMAEEAKLDIFNDENAGADTEPEIDRAEELRQKWGVESGQLWQLGEHRIICGDCTDKAVVERLMGGEKADMVVTDPPYGINLNTDLSNIKTDWKGWKGQGGKYNPVEGDDKPFDPTHIFNDYGYCKEIFLWGADYYAEYIQKRNKGSWIVWDKRSNEESGAELTWGIGSEFELCWSKNRHKRDIIRKMWSGLYGTETQDIRKRVHPTQKPIEVFDWIISKYSTDGEVIVDPYLGSGTTIIACENLNRKCRAVEISPAYVAVAIERWHQHTGKEPVLLKPTP